MSPSKLKCHATFPWFAICVGLGVSLGVAFHNVAIGIVLGVVFGTIIQSRRSRPE